MESYKERQYIRSLRNENNRRIAVLGSGLVSHLCTKIHKDIIILTKRRTDIFLDSVYFHDTVENRFMLLNFGINFKSKKTPVYYYDNATGVTTEVATNIIRETIGREKMGDTTKPIVLSNMAKSEDEFINLFFDEVEFKKQLLNRSETIELYPTSIKEHEDFVRLYFDGDYIDVEYLINTIPQPFYSPLVHADPHVYQYNPLVFVTTSTDEDEKMVYSFNDCFWKRIFIKGTKKCIEFNKEDWDEVKFRRTFPEIIEYKINEVPYGRIKSLEVKDTKRIKHVGRFAQWQHSLTTEHIINKLIKLDL